MPTPYAPYAAVTALFGGALAWLRGPTTSDTHNGTSDKDLDSQDVKAADDGGPGSSVNSGGTFRGAVKPASVEVLPDAGDLSRQSGPLVEEPAPGVARHYGQPTEDEVTASASQEVRQQPLPEQRSGASIQGAPQSQQATTVIEDGGKPEVQQSTQAAATQPAGTVVTSSTHHSHTQTSDSSRTVTEHGPGTANNTTYFGSGATLQQADGQSIFSDEHGTTITRSPRESEAQCWETAHADPAGPSLLGH